MKSEFKPTDLSVHCPPFLLFSFLLVSTSSAQRNKTLTSRANYLSPIGSDSAYLPKTGLGLVTFDRAGKIGFRIQAAS